MLLSLFFLFLQCWLFCFFFFSSRRRHTRWTGDWSSDVCSSDLLALLGSIGSGARPPKQVMPKAKEAALEAVRLDDNLAEGHTSLAYVKLSYDWEIGRASCRERV